MDGFDSGEVELKLKKSVKAWGTARFKSVLIDELSDCVHKLPFDRCCISGDFAADESIEKVLSVDDDDTTIFCKVQASFTDRTQTSCSDFTLDDEVEVTVEVEIEKRTGLAIVSLSGEDIAWTEADGDYN